VVLFVLFEAEDGIRDFHVTGVQTCALPIWFWRLGENEIDPHVGDEASYAMPEAAIGFVSDVGVNFILAKTPEPRALAFLMSGLPVRGADALALGLADCTILAARMAEVRAGIAAAAAAGNVETALVSLMQAESIEPGPAEFSALADRLADCFGAADADEIVAAVTRTAAADPTVATLAEALASRSPTSLEAIVQSHR